MERAQDILKTLIMLLCHTQMIILISYLLKEMMTLLILKTIIILSLYDLLNMNGQTTSLLWNLGCTQLMLIVLVYLLLMRDMLFFSLIRVVCPLSL